MKHFFTTIQQAVYGRDYKTHFADITFWKGFRYLSLLVAIHIVVVSAVIGVRDFAPVANQFFDRANVASMIDTYVPAEMQVNVKDGVVTTADGLPVVIQLDEEQSKLLQEEGSMQPDLENFLVINPAITTDAIERFKEYKTAVLITSNELVAYDDNGTSIQITSLKEFPNMEVSRATILSFYESSLPYVKWGIIIGLPLLIVFLYVSGVIGQLIFLLILAGLTLLIAKIKKTALTYKQAYSISLYAITLPLLAEIVINFFTVYSLGLLTIPIVIVLVAVNLKGGKTAEESTVA
jgi:maltodextrin utilization protein YvdJ